MQQRHNHHIVALLVLGIMAYSLPQVQQAFAEQATTTATTSITTSLPAGCKVGYLFSTTTGQPCTQIPAGAIPGCRAGDLFSYLTGKSCIASTATNFPAAATVVSSTGLVLNLTSTPVSTDSNKEVFEYRVTFDGTKFDPSDVTLEVFCASDVSVNTTDLDVRGVCPKSNGAVQMKRVSDGVYTRTLSFTNTGSQSQLIGVVAKAHGGASGTSILATDKDAITINPTTVVVPPVTTPQPTISDVKVSTDYFLTKGQTYTISWNQNTPGQTSINFNDLQGNSIAGVSNYADHAGNTFLWTVPTNMANTGGHFEVNENINGKVITAKSLNFAIVQPQSSASPLVVVVPNGGANVEYSQGKTLTIRWFSSVAGPVSIGLKNVATGTVTPIGNATSTVSSTITSAFSYTIPANQPLGAYKIVITSIYGSASDESDNSFMIVAPVTQSASVIDWFKSLVD